MTETLLKRHWYDGWFYSIFIDSDRSNLRNKILRFLEKNKTVLDIGCGTGGFALKIAPFSKYVLGVDISESMIRTANRRKKKSGCENIDFMNANALELSTLLDRHFDYAVLSFFIHEVNPQYRLEILRQAKRCADVLLIYDYHVPLPRNLSAAFVKAVEYFAGREHFRNFVDFNQNGGIQPLLDSVGLTIKESKVNRPRIFQIVKAVRFQTKQ